MGRCPAPYGTGLALAQAKASLSLDFSPRLDALKGLREGRGFSPAEIAAPALCCSRAPRSLRPQAARGTGHWNNQEGLRNGGAEAPPFQTRGEKYGLALSRRARRRVLARGL